MVYEALLYKGVLDTVALRKAVHMSSPGSETRFNRALTDLQTDFKVLPVAVTDSGAWRYAFSYDITARHYPDLPEQAHHIGESQARQKLVELYLRSLGAARPADLGKLFGWRPAEVSRTLDQLARSGVLRRGLEVENQPGEWIALAQFLDG